MKRRIPKKTTATTGKKGGLYFGEPSTRLKFIRSGATLLDMVLGGGWPLGRMSNIIGDNSSGKTLLAIEACANFAKQFKQGKIWYRETEAAFDEDYANALGLPMDRVDFGPHGIDSEWDTIEDVFEDLTLKLKFANERDIPCLYIIDSLDALSDRGELKRGVDEGSYNMQKQKQLHSLFRKRVRAVKHSNMHLMIISQTRVKIGVTFGEKTTVSGDGSLQFYASQRLKLAKLNQLSVKRYDQKQVVGVRIKAKVTKNKIGLPHRECDFDLRFGFGVNDAAASLEWLITYKKTDAIGLTQAKAQTLLSYLKKLDQESYDEWSAEIKKAVRKLWPEVQRETLPTWSKY